MRKEYLLKIEFDPKGIAEDNKIYCYGANRQEAFRDLDPLYSKNRTAEDLIEMPTLTLEEFLKQDSDEANRGVEDNRLKIKADRLKMVDSYLKYYKKRDYDDA